LVRIEADDYERRLLPRLCHHPSAVLDERPDVVASLWLASYLLGEFLRQGVQTTVVIVSDTDGPTALPDAYWDPDFMPGFTHTQFSALYAFWSCPSARTEGSAYRELVGRTEAAQGDRLLHERAIPTVVVVPESPKSGGLRAAPVSRDLRGLSFRSEQHDQDAGRLRNRSAALLIERAQGQRAPAAIQR
jgi:hypothetical protein